MFGLALAWVYPPRHVHSAPSLHARPPTTRVPTPHAPTCTVRPRGARLPSNGQRLRPDHTHSARRARHRRDAQARPRHARQCAHTPQAPSHHSALTPSPKRALATPGSDTLPLDDELVAEAVSPPGSRLAQLEARTALLERQVASLCEANETLDRKLRATEDLRLALERFKSFECAPRPGNRTRRSR